MRTTQTSDKAYGEIQSMAGSYQTFRNSVAAGTGVNKDGFSFDMRYSNLDGKGYIDRAFTKHTSVNAIGRWQNENTMIKAIALIGEEHTGITWWGVPDYMMSTSRTYNPAGEYTDDKGATQHYDGETDNYRQNHFHLHALHRFNQKLDINGALFYTLV